MAKMMTKVPMRKVGVKVSSSPSRKWERTQDRAIELEVANVFKTLSAYFIVPATSIPPTAFLIFDWFYVYLQKSK